MMKVFQQINKKTKKTKFTTKPSSNKAQGKLASQRLEKIDRYFSN